MMVADRLARLRRWKLAVVAFEPKADVEEINLFAPEHSSECLLLDHSFLLVRTLRVDRIVEFVGFASARFKHLLDIFQRRFPVIWRQAHIQYMRLAGGHGRAIKHASLGSELFVVYAVLTVDDVP